MQTSWTEVALGAAVVIATVLFALIRAAPETDFDRRVAALNAQLQTLNHLHREIQRPLADPAKGEALRRRWIESQGRTDELVAQARDAARSEEQRRRVEQLVVVVNSVANGR